jgi:hypothetical protein
MVETRGAGPARRSSNTGLMTSPYGQAVLQVEAVDLDRGAGGRPRAHRPDGTQAPPRRSLGAAHSSSGGGRASGVGAPRRPRRSRGSQDSGSEREVSVLLCALCVSSCVRCACPACALCVSCVRCACPPVCAVRVLRVRCACPACVLCVSSCVRCACPACALCVCRVLCVVCVHRRPRVCAVRGAGLVPAECLCTKGVWIRGHVCVGGGGVARVRVRELDPTEVTTARGSVWSALHQSCDRSSSLLTLAVYPPHYAPPSLLPHPSRLCMDPQPQVRQVFNDTGVQVEPGRRR